MAVTRASSTASADAAQAGRHRGPGLRAHVADRPLGHRARRRSRSGSRAFIVYSLFSALLLGPGRSGVGYEADGYLSPFFSPLIGPGVLPAWFSPGDPHPVDPARLPDDLLLLPQGLLPVVLRRPAGVRGRRAAGPPALRDGDGVPVHPPEPPPAASCTSRSCRCSSCGSTRSCALTARRATSARPGQRDPVRATSSC